MTIGNEIPLLCFIGLYACVAVVYNIDVRLRRRSYKKIALALNARYEPAGFERAGIISGQSNGIKFNIEDKSVGNAEAIVTEISVNCQNKILPPLIIYGRFLDNFPNWRHAVYQGNLFLGPKIEDKHKPLVQSLFQDIDITLLEPSFIRKGCFEIRPDKINFHKSGIIFNGIITDIEIIKQTIRLLAEISRRIESADISTKMGMITDQKEAKAGSLKIQMSTPIIIMAELTLLFGVFTIAVGIVWMFRQAMK